MTVKKVMNKRFLLSALAVIMVIGLLTIVSYAAIEETAKKIEFDKTTSFKMQGGTYNDYKVVIPSDGELKLSIETSDIRTANLILYNTEGNSLSSKSNQASVGSWNIWANLEQNYSMKKAAGVITYKLKKGTYYIRMYPDSANAEGTASIKPTFTSEATKAVTEATLTVSLKKGETLQLGTMLNPSSNEAQVKWSSGKKSVATVSSKGKVTAVAKGSVNIYAEVNGIELKICVKVTE